ncbi:hypothetical protein RFI_21974 [Reticulomyxa filosa]|uniref:Uncharacterized protein n=1 Tax=Reticulomyxa filosa TaxID=46433 RepID=X6MP32_RETFI|nr:hypothetical protein RFI_21974 [Reticulomyxa filosa]|eukprot:ETO15391.1 hypothetical protein RFI_21974 [Reticulomyxa filosa]
MARGFMNLHNQSKLKLKYFALGVPSAPNQPVKQTPESTMAVECDPTPSSQLTVTVTMTPWQCTKYKHRKEKTLENVESVSKGQIDIVLDHVNGVRNEKRKQSNLLAAKERAEQLRLQKQQQRQVAALSIAEMVPWITSEQAIALLVLFYLTYPYIVYVNNKYIHIYMNMYEMKNNVQRAIEYCMSTEPTEVCDVISNYMARQSETETSLDNDSLIGVRSHLDKRVLTRNQTDGLPKSVTFQVTEIDDDGLVQLRGVLDRNQIPLNPQRSPVLLLPLQELIHSNNHFVADEVVQCYCQCNILKVVFQVCFHFHFHFRFHLHSEDQDQTEFTPISLVPNVRELEYKFDFDNHHDDGMQLGDHSLKLVSHIMDGPVLFEGKYDDGSLGLVGTMLTDSPVELFTQVIDEETHNIIMILIDDIRDNIAIEVKNLTHLNHLTLQDCMNEFNRDALGHKLSYRIVVKDSHVIAILAPLGDEIKQLPFLERHVPPQGSLVKVQNGNRVAIVNNIPTGLIVTNNPKDELSVISCKHFQTKELLFPREESILFRKHVADLHGFIDCEVICQNGQWMLEKSDRKAFNQTKTITLKRKGKKKHIVWFVLKADDDIQNEYLHIKESFESEVSNNFMALLGKISSIVQRLQDKLYADINESNNALKEANEILQTVKNMKNMLAQKNKDQNVDPQITAMLNDSQSKITTLERELRALRFEANMS